MRFLSTLYRLSLYRKVKWVNAALALDVSVVWMDLDIAVFRNPLPFFATAMPSADMMAQSDEWGEHKHFEGHVHRIRIEDSSHGRSSGDGKIGSVLMRLAGLLGLQLQRRPNEIETNGGLWMVRPTRGGRALIGSWLARMHVEYVVKASP